MKSGAEGRKTTLQNAPVLKKINHNFFDRPPFLGKFPICIDHAWLRARRHLATSTLLPQPMPRHLTSMPGHRTPDTGHRTLDTGPWTLDLGHWTLDIGHWTLDIGYWTGDRGQGTGDRGQGTGDRGQGTGDSDRRWLASAAANLLRRSSGWPSRRAPSLLTPARARAMTEMKRGSESQFHKSSIHSPLPSPELQHYKPQSVRMNSNQ